MNDTIREFRDAIQHPRNKYLDEWLASGKQVMGLFCLSNPLEIVTAAGLMPYRIRGCQSFTENTACNLLMSNQVCSFVRNILDLMLSDQYDFVSGILSFACQQLDRAIQVIHQEKAIPFQHALTIPRQKTEEYFPVYLDELNVLIQKTEAHFNCQITDDDLEHAIQVHNSIRARMMLLYELRKAETPPLTGTEALTISQAALAIPPAVFNDMLGRLLDDLRNANHPEPYRARIAISGGEMEGISFMEQIEGMGALSVVELICFGWRFFQGQIADGPGSPLERIARFYFFREPSEHADIVEDFRADGVIIQRLKFCDSFALLAYNQAQIFQECGIPVLCLERDFYVDAQGQNQTRVQAFLEKIGK